MGDGAASVYIIWQRQASLTSGCFRCETAEGRKLARDSRQACDFEYFIVIYSCPPFFIRRPVRQLHRHHGLESRNIIAFLSRLDSEM